VRAIGRCELAIVRRPRGPGAEVATTIRMDLRDVEQAIHELAATIGMRATLTPIGDDGNKK